MSAQRLIFPKGVKFLAVGLAFALAALPMLLADNLAFVDYVNHLARCYIVRNFDTAPGLAQFYELKDRFYPFMRSVIGFFASFVTVETAGRLFAVIATSMPAAGAPVFSVGRSRAGSRCHDRQASALIHRANAISAQTGGKQVILKTHRSRFVDNRERDEWQQSSVTCRDWSLSTSHDPKILAHAMRPS